MTRHFRFKFTYEVFVNIYGYPPDIDFFPTDETLNQWKAIYLMNGIGTDEWYILHLQKRSDNWKAVYGLPFHLEYWERL